MNTLYDDLYARGLISEFSREKIRQKRDLFSVHWEVKTLLYLGVVLLGGGLGLLVYKNIDTIGHQAVLALILAISAGSFVFCFYHSLPFSADKVTSPNAVFDYILLLGSITFVTLIAYLQFVYTLFGLNYGLAALIPMVVLFFVAYYFDHMGILNMAIANLAIWMGVSVTPRQLLINEDFNSETIIYTYLLLGIVLLAASYLTQFARLKKHFKFSYLHYGINLTFIALLAGYFHFYDSVFSSLWIALLFAIAILLYRGASRNRSFYFLLLVILYSYFAISSLVIRLLILTGGGAFSLISLYFIGSAIALILLLITLNKKIKADDRL